MPDLGTLSRYRFEGKSEQAVREEWIRPLLVHLGYGIDTLNEVRYEEQLRLAAPLRRLGRVRVQVDYRPTVLGHGLWIIEAKGPARDGWDDAISQAWLYATHPEVDVPLMVIADGARIAVFDVYKPDWDDPVVDIETPVLKARFKDLAVVLGASSVTRAIRTRRLRHLGAAMRAEVSLARLQDYRSDVDRLAKAAEPAVIDNQRSILRHQHDLEDRLRKEAVAEYGLLAVGVWTNRPFALNLQPAQLGLAYVKELPPAARAGALDGLVASTIVRRGPHGSSHPRMFWMLRLTALYINFELRDDQSVGQLARERARTAVRDHILNFSEDPIALAAHRYERVLPVFILRSLITETAPDLSARARAIQEHWSDELRLRVGLDRDRVLTDTVAALALRVWTTMPWTAEALNAASAALEDAIPQLADRTDRARGPAGDPYLQWTLDRDQLQLTTIGQLDSLGDSIWPGLLDADVRAALVELADSDPDHIRIADPARRVLSRVGS